MLCRVPHVCLSRHYHRWGGGYTKIEKSPQKIMHIQPILFGVSISKLGGTMMSLPKLQHDGMFIYPSASGRVEGWQHHDEPSHNYKMAARSAIMIHYPRAAACLYREAKEFKKSLSSRRAQFTRLRAESQSRRHHDEPSHNYKMAAKSAIMIHYPRAAACLYREAKEFKKRSSSRRAHHDPLA